MVLLNCLILNYILVLNLFGVGKNCGSKNFSPLMWTWGASSAKWNAFGRFCEDYATENKVDCLAADSNATHRSTVERLCTWEEKLYQEVKVSQL